MIESSITKPTKISKEESIKSIRRTAIRSNLNIPTRIEWIFDETWH